MPGWISTDLSIENAIQFFFHFGQHLFRWVLVACVKECHADAQWMHIDTYGCLHDECIRVQANA